MFVVPINTVDQGPTHAYGSTPRIDAASAFFLANGTSSSRIQALSFFQRSSLCRLSIIIQGRTDCQVSRATTITITCFTMDSTSIHSSVDVAAQRERMLHVLSLLPVNYTINPPDSFDALCTAIAQVHTAFTQHSLPREDAALAVEFLFKTFTQSGIVARPSEKYFSGVPMLIDDSVKHGCDCEKSSAEHECVMKKENMTLEK
jgi:hypothetical protein